MHCLYQRVRLGTNANDAEKITIMMMIVGLKTKTVMFVEKKAISVAFAGKVTFMMTEKKRVEKQQKLQGQRKHLSRKAT